MSQQQSTSSSLSPNRPDDELTARRKELIRQIVDNPLFKEMITSIRGGIAMEMLNETDEARRAALFHENQALTRIVQLLTKTANEVKANVRN